MAIRIRRREFIVTLGGAAAAWPFAARAQHGERMRHIGVLMAYAESDLEGQASVAAFREELQKLGWEEGRNIQIDSRWAALDAEAMQRFATELVALKPGNVTGLSIEGSLGGKWVELLKSDDALAPAAQPMIGGSRNRRAESSGDGGEIQAIGKLNVCAATSAVRRRGHDLC